MKSLTIIGVLTAVFAFLLFGLMILLSSSCSDHNDIDANLWEEHFENSSDGYVQSGDTLTINSYHKQGDNYIWIPPTWLPTGSIDSYTVIFPLP